MLRRLRENPRGLVADAENYLGKRRSDTALLDTTAVVDVTDSLPNVVPVNFRVEDRPVRAPFLNVMIPGMALWAMSGGPNTVLNLTLRLARAGVPVRYVSTDVAGEPDHDRLWEHLHEVTGIAERYDHVEFVNGHDRSVETVIGADDVFLGTAWWTAQMIKHVLPSMQSDRFIYFIQDFEPGLYPWSSTYALALETYGLNHHAIVNEAFLLEHLRMLQIGNFGQPLPGQRTVVFEPAVDRTVFFQQERTADSKRRLVFYARPSAPRNLYELGLVALKRAAEHGAFPVDAWELRFMGDRLPAARLTPEVVVQPLPWLDFAAYASLLRNSDVGLSLMLSPHTGYPVLELAACGAAVVTNTFGPKTADRLAAISPRILAATPTVESITAALLHAVELAGQRLPENNVSLPANWESVFEPRIADVLAMIDDCRR
jgi:glycosyltransferase involved in cell wall biosynthesis